MGRITTS